VPTPYRPVAEEVDERYPLRLTTGRLRDQWHTMSRTGTIARLFAHEPEARLMVHAEDLGGLKEGELAKVSSRRGYVLLPVAADPDLPRGVVYLPMHWGERFLGGEGRLGVNQLTIGALDPSSRQPELKHCAVRIEPAELPWRLVAFGSASEPGQLFERLEPFMRAAPYATRTLIGRDAPGVRLAIAAREALDPALIARIDAAFGIDTANGIALQDGRLRAARLSGDTRAEPWLRDLWERQAEVGDLDTATEVAPRGRTVCNCFNVSEAEIAAFESLEELQAALKCGTNCGSCLPELRRQLVHSALPAP
jgi:assimilatory nitrate reductase catalytic subunit